ncbi:DUF5681 domain-containing protein [uncultured Thiodictyon sp.]|uniref:DUF5681 domain-containing protein n=1 Tax=uncultured Thiodictyon sp. TaxID=1846217 RepID=UPI0025FEFBCF|nr:DUF5681 domain-containing protein [uncultured Thiodictyon sp.]
MAQFQPGETGNPKGRPRKPKPEGPAKLRADLLRDAPDILAALVEQAKSGDPTAARLVLDRCLPALRPTDAPANLPPGIEVSDLTGAPVAVLKALAAGALSPDQAATIAGALSALVKVREFTELESRIAALESRR